MWAKESNSSNITWNEANDYCKNLTLAGYSNWRLPTIDELRGIYDPTQNVNGRHIKGGIKLSGWTWSSSTGTSSGTAWHFNFREGKQHSTLLVNGQYGRALCVRRSGGQPASNVTPQPSSPQATLPAPQSASTWTDPATGLTWAKESNSSLVTWNQAKDYCANLRLGGYSNWQLPTIDQLAGIYDQTQNVGGCLVKGEINFHGYCGSWSSSPGSASGEAWFFYFFGTGELHSFHVVSSLGNHALCVRP
jgi:hypothetical protein